MAVIRPRGETEGKFSISQLPFNCQGYELVMRLQLPVMISPRLGATALLFTCLAG